MEKFKLNNRGVYIALTVTAVFLLTTLLIFLMMPQLSRMVSASKDTQVTVEDMIVSRNRDERIAALISNINPSFIGIVSYGDEYGDITVAEVDANYNPVSTSLNAFVIKNATDLTISFNATPADGFEASYDAHLIYEGEVVATASGDSITLSNSFFYNPMTNETNYGDYTINVTEYDGTNVTHQTQYNELTERVISVDDGEKVRNIYFNFE